MVIFLIEKNVVSLQQLIKKHTNVLFNDFMRIKYM